MPKLIRLYVTNVAIGFGIAGIFLVALLGLDVAGLRHLVLQTEMGWLAGLMIYMFSGTLFAGVQFGIAVMAMAEREPPRGGGLRQHGAPVPVRVTAPAARRTRR